MGYYHRRRKSNVQGVGCFMGIVMIIAAIVQWLIHLGDHPKTRREWYRNEYLNSPHWQQVRQQKLSQVGYRCQSCGRQIDHPDVHHLNYKNVGHENMSDLQVLCRHCHNLAHS